MRKKLVQGLDHFPGFEYSTWQMGHFLNHTLPRMGWVGTSTGQFPIVEDWEVLRSTMAESDSYPTYPYRKTPRDPINPTPIRHGPVLTGADVDDYGHVEFVADPFLWLDGQGTWHMFFEIYNGNRKPDSVIGHATSEDVVSWDYDQVVLDTGSHVSFPYVFKWEGEMYMLVEQQSNTADLYRATDFPREWELATTLIELDHPNDDLVAFRWDDRWWLLVGDRTVDGLQAYYSSTPTSSDWTEHKSNPVVADRPTAVRPAGRPIVHEDGILMFYQDCRETYGQKTRAYQITDLDSDTFVDEEIDQSPILEPTGGFVGWNSGKMHHIDPWWTGSQWVCAVDGNVGYTDIANLWSISIYVS